MHACMHACIHTYIHIYVCNFKLFIYIHRCEYTYIHACSHAQVNKQSSLQRLDRMDKAQKDIPKLHDTCVKIKLDQFSVLIM